MTKLFTLMIAFSSSVVFAKFTPPNAVEKSPDAPSPPVFQAGSNAALQLVFAGSESWMGASSEDERSQAEECSGTAISNDGYILTALHCLSTCTTDLVRHQVSGGVYYQMDTPAVQKGSVSCSVTVAFNNRTNLSARAQVIATGRGFVEQGSPQLSPAIKALMDQGIGPINDYAIIKLPKNPAAGCLKTASTISVGEKVWNMAYPAQTSRSNHFNAPGEEVMFSSGVVTVAGAPVQSTIDLVPSSSGSGLFDYNGQLIALSNSVSVPVGIDIVQTESPGSATATPISHILADASAIFGSTVVNQAFNCY